MAKDNQQVQTMEEYLLSQLDTPVSDFLSFKEFLFSWS